MGKKTDKKSDKDRTNVMRLLDAAGMKYEEFTYDAPNGALSGVEVASQLGLDVSHVYKTLVTTGKSGAHYVFDVPVAEELDLKKAAAAAGEKSIEMLKSKDLLPLTGYIHGGCSPIGMKKQFATFIHVSALDQDDIFFSGGRIGTQVRMNPKELEKMIPLQYADIISERKN